MIISTRSSLADKEAEDAATSETEIESCDHMIFSHGHFTRCFIARWCAFDISAGYHFSADPGCVSEISKFQFLFLFWVEAHV